MPDARAALERLLDAIEARDVQAVADTLADDVSLETEVLGAPITGKQELQRLLADTMDAYESIRVERRKIVASGRDAAALVRAHVRFRGDLEMLGETLPTAGKELNVLGAAFIEVDEAGKITRMMRVRDTLGIVQQLGLSAERMQGLARKLEEWMKQPPSRAA
ncbi:MAG TPA: nuclear transport factor 2 family protein [Longimicrobiales bacterium]